MKNEAKGFKGKEWLVVGMSIFLTACAAEVSPVTVSAGADFEVKAGIGGQLLGKNSSGKEFPTPIPGDFVKPTEFVPQVPTIELTTQPGDTFPTFEPPVDATPTIKPTEAMPTPDKARVKSNNDVTDDEEAEPYFKVPVVETLKDERIVLANGETVSLTVTHIWPDEDNDEGYLVKVSNESSEIGRLQLNPDLKDPEHVLEAYSLQVKPEERRKGIGSRLIEEGLKLAEEKGFSEVKGKIDAHGGENGPELNSADSLMKFYRVSGGEVGDFVSKENDPDEEEAFDHYPVTWKIKKSR